MAVDMSNVKQIMHNNKDVIKIEDHLGNIIWQKPSIYRRLEYIKFNGAEYVNTVKSITTSNINQRVIEFKIHVKYNNITDWSVMGYDTSSGNTRFNLGVNGSGYSRFGVANVGTWQDSDGFRLDTNTTYFAVVGYNANNSKKGYYWNEQKGTKTITTNTLSATGNLYIGAVNYDGSPSSYGNCWIYQAEIAVGAVDNYVAMMIPCQRKSDNRCGLYDTVRQRFLPMNGTSITTAAAGPVAEENWDPTV